jgi:LuxR family maltose regulon positive regulatory protein
LVRLALLELLGRSYEYKLTLISAPTGYGKTTILAQWWRAEAAGLSFAWVSLDEQDNDPVRMWKHILESLREAIPEVDFRANVLVGMSAVGQNLVVTTLPMLINELANLPHRVVLVLDDYQFVTEDRCHESVAVLLEHLPENVHLVLASRSDPPLPLGRLRARGELNEIRDEQLAFSEEEAACLLNEKMGLGIDSDDLRLLLESTEGWPAGIYLAALSMQNREDNHTFVESYGGSDRYIVELLAEQVLTRLPEEVRDFLLRTSVLRRMNGPLCDEVVNTGGSGKLLRELAHANLFIVPLDERGEWYRYHQLFSDFLFYELESTSPELVPILHGRASAWLEGAGYFDDAIRHAIAAKDHERGRLLIARHWFGYMLAGQMATVERWLEALPKESSTHDAALLLMRAWISALSGRIEEAERLLALAEGIPHEKPLPDGTASVEAGANLVRAVFGLGGIKSTVKAARRAAGLEGEQLSPRTPLLYHALGTGLYLSGEPTQAQKRLEEALELTDSGKPLLRMASLYFLSLIAADEGRLEEAESLASELRTVVTRSGLQGIPQASLVLLAHGHVLARRADLTEAQTLLESGLSARRRLPNMSPWPALIGLLDLAQVYFARGDRGGTRQALVEARTILEPFGDDTGVFTELLEHQQRKFHSSRRRNGSLNGELTGRELKVLELISEALSTRQIAERLYVAPSTVKTQIKSVYHKLDVSSRKEAVEEARARGLI